MITDLGPSQLDEVGALFPEREQGQAASPQRSPSASACTAYREAIESGLSRGRNAMAIWQNLVSEYGGTGIPQGRAGKSEARRYWIPEKGRETNSKLRTGDSSWAPQHLVVYSPFVLYIVCVNQQILELFHSRDLFCKRFTIEISSTTQ